LYELDILFVRTEKKLIDEYLLKVKEYCWNLL